MGAPFEDRTKDETRRGKMMADISKGKNVKHLVYSSVVNADKNLVFLILKANTKLSNTLKVSEYLILLSVVTTNSYIF